MLTSAPPLCGLVLAGGESRRMGRDKSRLPWQGQEQRLRCAELLSEFCTGVFVSLRTPETLQPYTVLTDLHPGIGPMAGLLSAFAQQPAAAWLLLACDLPLVGREAVQLLVDQRDPAALATCFCHQDGRLEPLAAIWEPAAAPLLEDARAAGHYGLQALLLAGRVERVPVPFTEWLLNANTPAEWDLACLLAGKPELK
ncbi:MAG: molybdenum cofactor guanylyltransferase [Chitinophagaceae bacterium]|nr:MAG: molybdenum cofactor guanylyltransferase [Chitinophagaceae bacterium]